MTQAIIDIHNLSKRYPKAASLALDNINLSIDQGEFFGLLGPNGSGKTTLISILCGLLNATQGEFNIDGQAFSAKTKQFIALVPQEIALYPTLTLHENLNFFAKLYGIPASKINQRVSSAIEVAQLTEYADQVIEKYSGGMQRRANLVASLIHDPKIIFLDEPSVNIDPQSRQVIHQHLTELHQQGKTLIYTTHYLNDAEQLCSRVAIIDNGKMLVDGTPQQLIDNTPDCQHLDDVFMQLTGKALRDSLCANY